MSAHIPKNSSHRRPAKHEAADYGSDRKHLTSRDVERLIEAAKGSRNEARDRCLLLLMFRNGSLPLRAHPHMLRHACGFALADQGRGCEADSGLSRTPEHSAHRQVHRQQPGAVPETLELNRIILTGNLPVMVKCP